MRSDIATNQVARGARPAIYRLYGMLENFVKGRISRRAEVFQGPHDVLMQAPGRRRQDPRMLF